jgi:energy-coupling factor transport system ATP-binding protein
MTNSSDCLTLDHISFSFPASDGWHTVLKDVDLRIRQGEWLTIVGTNGSGKSTLAKIIAGLYPVSSGTITCYLLEKPASQLIFQNPDTQIMGETLYEDVCFGMVNMGMNPDHMQKIAIQVLEKVGLSRHIHASTSLLSGGQKQLLAVAGCLAVNPPILIFDEASSMLDPLARQTLLRVIQELHHEGKTIVWITQLLDELAFSDRVAAIEHGALTFLGTKQNFFYGCTPSESSHCEQMGFAPPYTIQTAQALISKGYQLDPLPISPIELSKAVSKLR